ncbi:putative cytochrome P450 6a14 [Arctopsyche grandis]|uniref:putative cytochrome P450 6a14 n=1 Tax=Arctopsyche grandis TaxID=121162 RepID=UPI00406D9A7A
MFQIDLSYLITIVIGIVIVSVYKFINLRNYWKNKNVPFVSPLPIVGNHLDLILNRRTIGHIYQDYYHKFKNEKYVGLFRMQQPTLLIRDLELSKYVLIKNFNSYQNRDDDHNELKEKLTSNMVTATSEKWRKSRQKLSPTFTSGKLRNMFYLILEKGEELQKRTDLLLDVGGEINVHELVANYTTEVIGSCAFGLQLNTMMDTKDQFRRMGRLIFTMDFKRMVKTLARIISPRIFYAFGFKVFPQTIEDFFVKIVKDMMVQRKKSPIKRNDFIDLLLELKYQDGNEDKEMDDMYLAAQAFIFFAAGFETSSLIISATIQEMAFNPDIQGRLVQEIESVIVKHDGKLTYDGIAEMEYLDMVISETMRKYPVVGIIPRTCTATDKLPDTDLVVEKGTKIAIPVLALHYDPNYFPDPEKYDPERFTAEAKRDRHPMVYLPFGEGPRNFIGLRFGKIQTKIGIISMLRNYKFEPTEKTKNIRFKPRNFVHSPIDSVILRASKRNTC